MSDRDDEVPEGVEVTQVADQDAAMEAAFEAGTLPEEDRRAPDVIPIVEPCATCTAMEAAAVGTTLERQLHGWKLKMQDGGTVRLTEGETITLALAGLSV